MPHNIFPPATPVEVRDSIRSAADLVKHIHSGPIMGGVIRTLVDLATEAGLDAYAEWLANIALTVEDRPALFPGEVITVSRALDATATDLHNHLGDGSPAQWDGRITVPGHAGADADSYTDQEGNPITVGDIIVSQAEDVSGKVVALSWTRLDGPGGDDYPTIPGVVVVNEEGETLGTLAAEETRVVWHLGSGQ